MSGILQTLIASIGGAITDTYFNLVTLLLPGNGTNGAQNNTFLDSSTNNFTITRNGNTTQGTFSPFSQTGWSNYFDGTGDSLTVPDNAAFDLGSGAFTVEAWVYYTATNNYGIVCGQWGGVAVTGASAWIIRQDNASKFQFVYTTNGTTETSLTATNAFSLNTWNHVVACRDSSNNWALFMNGVRQATSTASATIFNSTYSFSIGGAQNTTDLMTGYVSNVRVVKGTAVYDPTQSTLTVPTAPLTAITNTSFLSCQSNRFIDNSTNAFTITRNGDVSVQAFSPFAPTAAYSAATVGGSGYFDGTGDYLVTQSSANLAMGSGDVTVECWFYALPSANQHWIFDFRTSGSESTTRLYAFIHETTNVLNIGFGTFDDQNAGTPTKNTWNHLAIVRSGSGSNNVSVYLNGSRNLQLTDTTNLSTSTQVHVGRRYSATSSQHMEGYIAGLRALKGTAQYSGSPMSPSVPTAPPTAITNTQLLLNFTNAGITDATAKNDLETVGNAQISTTQSKWGGGSLAFDGTGDSIVANSGARTLEMLTGDFTIECWIRFASVGNGQIISGLTGANTLFWQYYTSQLQFGQNNVGSIAATNWSPSANTWYHIAVTRSGTTVRQFVDGVQLGSNATSSASFPNGPVSIGTGGAGDLNGFIDDLRVTKGYARYTANFTAPTAAFPLQ